MSESDLHGHNGWTEWGKYVLEELKSTRSKMEIMMDKLTALKVESAIMKTKIGMMSAVVGAVVSAVVSFLFSFLRH